MTEFRDRIAVIDYGMGNLHSVAKALEHVAPGARVVITTEPRELERADRVVFPGVGAIGDCMREFRAAGFASALVAAIAQKPVLAICVGMQALMAHSEESGGVDCLGLLPGRVRFFGAPLIDTDGERLKVPHMGWNVVHQTVAHPLWHGIAQDTRFYFVHSYWVETDADLIAGTCDYGVQFAAALHRGNLFAVQFHPEKSHSDGLRLLANFAAWKGGD